MHVAIREQLAEVGSSVHSVDSRDHKSLLAGQQAHLSFFLMFFAHHLIKSSGDLILKLWGQKEVHKQWSSGWRCTYTREKQFSVFLLSGSSSAQ